MCVLYHDVVLRIADNDQVQRTHMRRDGETNLGRSGRSVIHLPLALQQFRLNSP